MQQPSQAHKEDRQRMKFSVWKAELTDGSSLALDYTAELPDKPTLNHSVAGGQFM